MESHGAKLRQAAPRGRPRDPHIDASVLEATLAVLQEVGYAALSLEMVARRAGVTRPSMYRRWPTKAALVVHAITTVATTDPAPDTGNLREDLEAVAVAMARLYDTPLARRVIPSLLGDLASHEELRDLLHDRYVAPRRESVKRALARAEARGQIAPVRDPDLICDLLAGPLFHTRFVLDRDIDDQYARAIVDALMTLIHSTPPGLARRSATS